MSEPALPRGRALLPVSPEFLIEMVKTGGRPCRHEVVKHALPADATLTRVRFDGSEILLEVASATFAEPVDGESPARLPAPHIRLIESDQQIVHDACRLRDVLVQELAMWTGELPAYYADVLATTQQYQLLPIAPKGVGHD